MFYTSCLVCTVPHFPGKLLSSYIQLAVNIPAKQGTGFKNICMTKFFSLTSLTHWGKGSSLNVLVGAGGAAINCCDCSTTIDGGWMDGQE